MSMVNQVQFYGRVTAKPQIRVTAIGTKVASWSIAVNERKGEDAQFFNLTAFGKTAENVEKYVEKGVPILVRGRAQNDNYTNKEGQKVYRDSYIINEVIFTGGKTKSTEQPQQHQEEVVDDPTPSEVPEELPFM